MALSIRSFTRAFLALSASRMRSRFCSISSRSFLSAILTLECDLVLLGQLDGDLEAADHRPGELGREPGGLDGLRWSARRCAIALSGSVSW